MTPDPWGQETAELLGDLRARGLRFDVEGSELKVSGLAEVLEDPSVLGLLRQRKLDLIAFLQGDESRGFRRLPNGKVLWKVQRPSELKQSSALD